jgi:hypothetical protein
MADFGTSIVGARELGDSITVKQFTTLENTPVEFLLHGSHARQSYSADTFMLGISMLHLLAGHEPYEELLKDVRCTPYLYKSLMKHWDTSDIESPYFVISQVMSSLVVEDDSDETDTKIALDARGPGAVICDTLYRYLVLFGQPSDAETQQWSANPIWLALMDSLGFDLPDTFLGPDIGHKQKELRRRHLVKSNVPTTKIDSIEQYRADRAVWALHSGTHPIMKSARVRMEALGSSAWWVLERMVSFDPARRCSMKEVIRSNLFVSLRHQTPPSCNSPDTVVFDHFRRTHLNGGTEGLAIL